MPAIRSLTLQPNHAHTDAAHDHARGLVQQPPCSLCPRGCCATTMHPRGAVRLPPGRPTSAWPMSTCSSRHISPVVGSQDDHRSSTQSRRLMTRPPDAQARARLALLRSMPPSCPSPPLQASIASSSTTRCRDGDRDRPTICCVGHPRHRRPPVETSFHPGVACGSSTNGSGVHADDRPSNCSRRRSMRRHRRRDGRGQVSRGRQPMGGSRGGGVRRSSPTPAVAATTASATASVGGASRGTRRWHAGVIGPTAPCRPAGRPSRGGQEHDGRPVAVGIAAAASLIDRRSRRHVGSVHAVGKH